MHHPQTHKHTETHTDTWTNCGYTHIKGNLHTYIGNAYNYIEEMHTQAIVR